MSEPVLITGGEGFVGRALAARARESGAVCLGIGRQTRNLPGYSAIDLASSDSSRLTDLLAEQRPEIVYHLAGGAGRGQDPFASNVVPTRHLLAAVHSIGGYAPRIVVAGSAAEYGDLGSAPIREDARERPVSEYGVAKLAQTRLALLARRRGIPLTVVRPFNIIGPGMALDLAPARFAREALGAKTVGRGFLTVGDLSPVRDYLDIEDVAGGLWALGHAEPREEIVNLCSGEPVRMSQILEEILRQVCPLEVRTDASLLRGPADVPVSVGDPGRLAALVGERYGFDLERSIARLLLSLG